MLFPLNVESFCALHRDKKERMDEQIDELIDELMAKLSSLNTAVGFLIPFL